MTAPNRPDLGVRLIVLYKTVKALAEIALAVGLVVLAASGEIGTLREAARQVGAHLASRWSLLAGRVLASLVSERGVHLLEAGLLLDSVLSAVEGWSLWRGRAWGPWLVVIATALPLPLEVLEIVRGLRPGRIALVLLNVAVVTYLARRISVGRCQHGREVATRRGRAEP